MYDLREYDHIATLTSNPQLSTLKPFFLSNYAFEFAFQNQQNENKHTKPASYQLVAISFAT